MCLPQNLSSCYKAFDRDFSNLITTLDLLGFDDAVLGLCSAYISLLSSYSIFPSSVLETHRDWACLTDHWLAGAVENCVAPFYLFNYLTMSSHRVLYLFVKVHCYYTAMIVLKRLPIFSQVNLDNIFCPPLTFIAAIT